MQTSYADQARTFIQATKARVTKPRVSVLALLLGQKESLSHQEIQKRLCDAALDPVTLYRVLEWLTDHQLVHRIAGADQAWRFSAGSGQHKHEHAHFQCTRCAMMTCFTDIGLPEKMTLPEGFRSEEVEVLIKGTCPNCNRAA